MFKKILLLSLVSILIFSSCAQQEKKSPLLNKEITKNNLSEITQMVKDDKIMTRKEIELLAGGVSRLATDTENEIVGMTIGDVIENQENFIKENTIGVLEQATSQAAIVKNHKFDYVGLKPEQSEDNNIDILVFEITNNSDKEIVNMKGVLQFYGPQNELVKNYPVELKNVIGDREFIAGEKLRFAYPFEHDDSNQRDQIIRNQHGKLRPIWQPNSIKFLDGTTIAVKTK